MDTKDIHSLLNAWLITILLAVLYAAVKKNTASQADLSLKEAFKNDFFIGTALIPQQIEEKDTECS